MKRVPYAEYRRLLKLSKFRCPKNPNRNPKDCDGHSCPPRPENPMEDYYDECVEALLARLKLLKISLGEMSVLAPDEVTKRKLREEGIPT